MESTHTKRMRFGTTKSRNGCLPCKARHVKCGEERPTCTRCAKSNRVCHWGPRRISWAAVCDSKPCSPLALLPTTSAEGYTAFEYFVRRTVRQLVGTWGDSRWMSTIVQCAVADPGIQQVTIALGALQRLHEFGAGCQQYALAQYVEALRTVRACIAQTHHVREIFLLACVLFCAFECMTYHPDSAMSHLSSGFNLALQHFTTTATQVAQHHNGLTLFLLPVLTMLDNDRLCLGTLSPRTPTIPPADMPATFGCLQEAQRLLVGVLNTSLRNLAAVSVEEIPPNHEETLQKAQTWCQSLDEYLLQHVWQASDEDVTNLLPMVAWRVLMEAIMKVDYMEGELAWDRMLPQFELIVAAVESFLDLTVELIEDHEDWRHPISYTKEPSHERAEQTLTHRYGGQIREDVLARLLTNPTVGTARKQSTTQAKPQASRRGEAINILLRQARSNAHSSQVDGRARQAVHGLSRIRSTFTLSHGVVYPLFAVVCRCRDPFLRQRALRLLEVCNRHEGLWDSKLAAESAKRRILVEETRARDASRCQPISSGKSTVAEITDASQIPNHCRVRATARTFSMNGTILERFCFGWRGSLEEALAEGQAEEWVELRLTS